MSYQPNYHARDKLTPRLICPVSTVKQELDRNKNGAARLQIVDSAKESTKESAKKSIKGFAKQKSRTVIESADPERHRKWGPSHRSLSARRACRYNSPAIPPPASPLSPRD